MSSPPQKQRRIDWYTVSIDTVFGWVKLLLVAVVAVGCVFGFRFLRDQYLEREISRVVHEAEAIVDTLRSEPGVRSYSDEYETARKSLAAARSRRDEGKLTEAMASAERGRTLLTSILNALRHRGEGGEAKFIGVRGSVEYRRGERGTWLPARGRVVLNAGDYVKTASDGWAEIMSVDGTVYTVRSDTVILVGEVGSSAAAGEQTVNLEFGWVDLSTSRAVSRVTTPGAEARVREDSSAVISYSESAQVGRFATYRGEMEVSSANGETQAVKELQQVVHAGQKLSAPRPLPAAPVLLEPVDNLERILGRDETVQLAWEQVPGAQRYALQVARNRLFIDNIIDVENRAKTTATLGLRGEGTFVWRVAAMGAEGVKGPWSAPRRFRVSTRAAPGERAAVATPRG